jgi:putative DNA primase/helicase
MVGAEVQCRHEWLALRFSAEHHADWRYVALGGKWQQWTGTRWRSEDTLRAFELARRICRSASADCDKPQLAREIARAGAVAGVERLARADRRHAMRFDQYDAEDWDFNQPPRKE